MKTFEQKYYESDEFWKDGMVTDKYNLMRIRKCIELVPQETKTLVDLGCGNGIFAWMLKDTRPEIDSLSVDRSETAVKYVKTRSAVGDLTDLPFETQSFDCATCFEVLEHIPYPVYSNVLGELSRVAKKYILISVPFEERIEDDFTKCPACGAFFNLELHLRKYLTTDIQNLFSKNGFECIERQAIVKYNESYLGVKSYIRFRNAYLQNKGRFKSPVCPICGFENKYFNISSGGLSTTDIDNKPLSLKSVLKKYWPKVKVKAQWIVALYQRK